MLEAPIPNRRRGRCLTIALLATVIAAFASCATNKPQPALVDDPDSQRASSSIPWNKPQNWEGRENFPSGMGGDPSMGGQGY
jgi:hypothetical protein